ncbi:MarR family EPS-associated transcriptional regulator [Candidatus Endobugula sertula]|uniref:MarR family EPS-associated transcriptional regulator n=1 Tax=Candidatus Endobugula sertula TaxID=62101 RepID=A0A1D2QPQ4_9GAMM|nr:MarR family EPS-associated transcriptional regulator [Candidatus Endobugula sertula]
MTLDEETCYRLLKLVETKSDMSQRDFSRAMGVSLGKVNYCLNALLKQGWLKVRNFKNSKNKLAYAYLLTPKGIEQKACVTKRFLAKKYKEHKQIEDEIAALKIEAAALK